MGLYWGRRLRWFRSTIAVVHHDECGTQTHPDATLRVFPFGNEATLLISGPHYTLARMQWRIRWYEADLVDPFRDEKREFQS